MSDSNSDAAALLQQARLRLSIPDDLFALSELDVLYSEREEALWSYMRPSGRPSFTPPMLADFGNWQRLIAAHFGPDRVPLKYLILGSRAPGVFCFGGDLELFANLIRDGNRDALAAYGYRCVEILHRNMHSLDLPILTIGMVQGQALGGGFEALLSFDYIIAERGSSFGLPEVMFGLFPGMGAHAILSRRLGQAMADRIIMGNETYRPKPCMKWASFSTWPSRVKAKQQCVISSPSRAGATPAWLVRAAPAAGPTTSAWPNCATSSTIGPTRHCNCVSRISS